MPTNAGITGTIASDCLGNYVTELEGDAASPDPPVDSAEGVFRAGS